MTREIELRLTVSTGTHDALVGWLDANAQAANPVELANVYYDMRDQALARNHAALHIRRQGNQWPRTLRAAVVSTSGLSTRHGWEIPLQNDALSVDAFVANNATGAVDCVRPHTIALAPLFHTDFTRRLWHVGAEGGEIEIVLDADAILIPSTQARKPVDELELEREPADDNTLGEDAIVERLHAWTQTLRAVVPDLTSLDVNKARRGYQLRGKAVGGQTWCDAPIRRKLPSSMSPWWTRPT